jgi:hypothetical protein
MDPLLESLLGITGTGVIFLLYYLFVGIPKEREEKERRDSWIENNSETLQIQSNISKILEQIGQNHPPCKKCNSIHFQLWEVNSQITQIRCLDCKKIKNLGLDLVLKNKDDEEVSFLDLLIPYTSLVNSTMKEGNSPLGVYLKNHLIWDFGSLRNGTPIIRGITFFTNSNYEPLFVEETNSSESTRRISQQVMDKVWNRDNGRCISCGSNQKLEFDHIIPFSKGGSNTYRNIQLLCESCNRQKSSKIG